MLTHARLSSLPNVEQRRLLEDAVNDLAFDARLQSFRVNANGDRLYASVCLIAHRNGEDEYVTYLVCPRSTRDDRVYFDSGCYGLSEYDAINDLTRRTS